MTIHAFYLRKQPHHVTNSVKNESSVVLSMHNTENDDNRTEDALKAFIHDEACGIGVLTCMAFAHDQHKKIPVLCGTLKNAPVCLGPSGKKCDAFCDADGGSRVCAYAFSKCCSHSPNGCISSEPRNVVLNNK
ncbi:hypothetical protein O0I10_004401 [Lichtheimia ornata]|uniref:Uncharacterized protein n=1 Tax=Lichtheimia ornata TaxID=688661 RepID=A0AAD7V5M1_9FUNG|nr:uncharacterized protein O0I10_004401 [Lichtheimia ornata]KAJ8659808.1 hypothetical protein O0I10_004401 [Lichtheimia ornata]